MARDHTRETADSLAMEMEQERNPKNDRRQKDLADVKVQYLLVGG